MIRCHIVFYGWVQGVGFRYRARYAAQMLTPFALSQIFVDLFHTLN